MEKVFPWKQSLVTKKVGDCCFTTFIIIKELLFCQVKYSNAICLYYSLVLSWIPSPFAHQIPFNICMVRVSNILMLLYLEGASLVAQTVKRLPAMWETQVQPISWEDPMEKVMATHSNTLAWKILWTEEPGRLVNGVAKSQTWLSDFTFFLSFLSLLR